MNPDDVVKLDFLHGIMETVGCDEKTATVLLIVTGVLAFKFMASPGERPAWLKDCEPIGLRKAGAWRGKGSFGTHFGSQAKHR